MGAARVVRVLVAPDKFKGTLTARAAARAITLGVREAADALGVEVEFDPCPVADGGEGTADALAAAWGPDARRHQLGVCGPAFDEAVLTWWTDGEETAAFDSAAACGLSLVPEGDRNPAHCTTAGVGAALLTISRTERNILVGLGGSATIDAGVGMAWMLGWRFEDALGKDVHLPRGADLNRIARAFVPDEVRPVTRGLHESRLRVLCDVTTPLLGPRGCAALYGPQKGATPAQISQLDEGLRRLVDVVGVAPIDRDGAAGGLAYGMRVFAGPLARSVTLESGAKAVLDAVGFAPRVARADVVMTGEGRFDLTTYEGKAVGEVIAAARAGERPVLVVAGRIEPGTGSRLGVTLAACEPDSTSRDERDAARRLRAAAGVAFERWARNR